MLYPATTFRETHPAWVATQCALFGLPFAPVESCRVLEIGCGDGTNILPMAFSFPESHFVGIDLAATPVARGVAWIERLGLRNIELQEADVVDANFPEGSFDYVIAHGVYSWIPERARAAMLALIGKVLAPHGVAYVSYNALPGCRIRQAIRDMLLFHLRGVEGKMARVQAGRAYLTGLLEALAKDDLFNAALAGEVKSLLERDPAVMAHDEMSDVYHPLHLHEFLADCAPHGLQFLTEADSTRCGEGFRPPYAIDDEAFDIPAHAQELDFRVGRSFRRTLLVRDDVQIDRRPRPERLRQLHLASSAKRGEDGDFENNPKERFKVNDEVLAGVIDQAAALWPASLPIAGTGLDDLRLGALQRMYWTGLVELSVSPYPYARRAGDRPCAAPFVRQQALRGQGTLVTARHGAVTVPDAFSLQFIAGLDGARDRAAIAADVAATLGITPRRAREQIDSKLEDLARMGLMIS